LPKQNRPTVRDGKIQPRQKRTDRSYLGGAAPAPAEDTALVEDEAVAAGAAPEALLPVEPAAAFAAPQAVAPVPQAARPVASGKLPTAVRAIQQQGVRKRREFDVQALAVRDTQYAIHELRRIAVLASGVVVTLVVLTFVLR